MITGASLLALLALLPLHAFARPIAFTPSPPPIRRGFFSSAASVITNVVAHAINENPKNEATTTRIDPQKALEKYLRPALFAQAAYCPSVLVNGWTCGAPCDGLGSDVEVLQTGGDNGLIPRFFIAHDRKTESIVVSRQGTDSGNMLSILNDLKFALIPMNSTIFPGAPADAQVHNGFAWTQARTADNVLEGVRKGLAEKKVKSVKVVGHSLGAIVSMLDTLMLTLALGPDISVESTLFGLPRGGDLAFATFVESSVRTPIVHIAHQRDPVPNLPPRFLNFVRVAGEKFIRASGPDGAPIEIDDCPGRDNENCAVAHGLSLDGEGDHKGPYLRSDIILSSKGCPAT